MKPESAHLQAAATPPRAPLLEVRHLKKHYVTPAGMFGKPGRVVQAVEDVSFSLATGETLSLVGESGCGKTTTGKSVLRLIEPTSGSVNMEGEELLGLSAEQMRLRRQDMQIIFQDPYASLNPRMRAGDIVAEPMRNFRKQNRARTESETDRLAWLFAKVGLRPEAMKKYAYEFSGGQRQRLGVARALSLNPKLIVCDEPVSALDVSVQAQVINLLMDLQQEFGIAYLFVAHDLAVVRHISHRVAVMYLGKIVEIADRNALFSQPVHPYTQILLSAVPHPDPRTRPVRQILKGDPPSPANPPSGCRFHTRCPMAQAICKEQVPELTTRSDGHWVACHVQ